MESIDPTTGRPLPADAIQRILFIANSVHVYNIPPLADTKGYNAASWTADPKRHISTCRMRIIETSIPVTQQSSSSSSSSGGDGDGDGDGDAPDKVKVDIVLEDGSSGQLFAAAPYTTRAAVESAQDSSRFFALRVQDESGRKATLGIGFEERGEAFDFGVALQEAQKTLEQGPASAAATAVAQAGKQGVNSAPPAVKRDYSLKEGETITVNLSGTRFGRRARPQHEQEHEQVASGSLSGFSLPPPPPSSASSSSQGGNAFLPPPPSAQRVRAERRKSAQALGFDDGQHHEFA